MPMPFSENVQQALDVLPDAIILVNVDGVLQWINRQAEMMFGYTRDELVGKQIERLLPERFRADHGRHMAAYVAEPRARPMGGTRTELIGLRKSGDEFPVDISLSPMRVEEGLLVIASVRDITERKRAEEALRNSDARHRALLKGLPDLIFILDSNAVFLDYYTPDLSLLLVPPERFLGRPVGEVMPPELARQIEAAIADAMRTDEAQSIEYTLAVGESQPRHFEARVIPTKESTVTIVARDITERVRGQRALHEAEELMRFALEASRLGVWEANLKTGVSYWSETCEVMHGLERGTFGKSFSGFIDRIHPEDRELVLRTIDEAIREHQDAELEYRTLLPGGTERRISSTAHFFYDEAGVPLRGAGVSIDVTERRALEAQLRQANKMEAVGQLAGGIAHDFNNLLTAISGFTELVLLTLEDADSRRADLFEVRKAATRAAALTRQLLAFSRRQILQPQVIDLNALVGGIEQLLHRTIGEDIALVLAFDRELEPVRADPGQFEQVLLNLAVNARDAMPKGGQLRFVTEMVDVDHALARTRAPMTPGRYVRLTVTDTGTGMSPEVQNHVFEPFFTTKELHKGTGLGLATVYAIVKQSDGFVWVNSQVGLGTSFEIYLPASHEAVEPLVRVEPTLAVTGGSETILLAEDDGAVRRLARQALTHYGYTVLEARDGDEALQVARSDRRRDIHLLVTDVVMPGLSGRDLAVQLAKEWPEMRVLYTSGYAEPVTVRAGLERGVPVLSKPFLPIDLLQRVREALDVHAGPVTDVQSPRSPSERQ